MLQVVLAQALDRAERTPPGIGFRLTVWGIGQWLAFRQWRRYRRTVRTLQGLDDRTLHDIGIHRSEIESYAASGDTGRFPARSVDSHLLPRG